MENQVDKAAKPKKHWLSRKPVGGQPTTDVEQPDSRDGALKAQMEEETRLGNRLNAVNLNSGEDVGPALPTRPPISLQTSMSVNSPGPQIATTPGGTPASDEYFSLSAISPLPSGASTPTSESAPKPTNLSKITSGAQKGYQEVRHFAGGLLSHPSESTRHFSILRHSNGLVFYQGTATAVTISIFADAPLPADHSLWLQSKGWSGNTGMRARALVGRNGYWLDVTPSIAATASQLDPHDERAWQRDIAKFLKKADKKVRTTHVLRQTAIVRIPVDAGDGYFRLVLCEGPKKKVLCPSPVFRVLSTSASPSSVKGSSLSTLPLEMGAMVLTTALKVTAMKAVAPVTMLANAEVQRIVPTPSSLAVHAASATYKLSGASHRVDEQVGDANSRYNQLRETVFAEGDGPEATPDSGPQSPYPVAFPGFIDSATGNDTDDLGLPSMEVTKTSEEIPRRLNGYYFGWVKSNPQVKKGEKPSETAASWFQAVISSLPIKASGLARVHVTHSGLKKLTITLIEDTADASFKGANIDVKIMGFIRPPHQDHKVPTLSSESTKTEVAEIQEDTAMEAALKDIAIAQASLDRPAWGPELVVQRSESGKAGGLDKAKSGYAHTRATVQRQVDRVPFYRAGVRVGADKLRDKAVGTGGVYILR